MERYVITRQAYYYSGLSLVEVAIGGWDYTGSDVLSNEPEYKQFHMETVYTDPREAAKNAIKIRDFWKSQDPEIFLDKYIDNGVERSEETSGLCYNHNLGWEGEWMPEDEFLKKADEMWEKLPKCWHCGGLLPDEYYTSEYDPPLVHNDEIAKFCRESCVEKWELENCDEQCAGCEEWIFLKDLTLLEEDSSSFEKVFVCKDPAKGCEELYRRNRLSLKDQYGDKVCLEDLWLMPTYQDCADTKMIEKIFEVPWYEIKLQLFFLDPDDTIDIEEFYPLTDIFDPGEVKEIMKVDRPLKRGNEVDGFYHA